MQTEKKDLLAHTAGSQTAGINQEIDVPKATLVLVSQGDLRAVQYALYLLSEDETDSAKKTAYKNVEDALHEITNHCGADGIASRELMQEYFPEKFSEAA